ncbi:hypothetical protein [Akkermansia sp.]|uniref:hypothetical protein n=1 Tax=Akkermansia sp. TaxID=1872421 RepID=UPI003AB31B3E
MIVPMIDPDGKAVLPVDSIMRQVLRDCFMWTDKDFEENDWIEKSSELEWLYVLREYVRSIQASAFKEQYAPMLEELNAAVCWRIWFEDTTPVWMTGVFEDEPSRAGMTPEELKLAALADAGKLHPCVPWLSSWPVWFPTPEDEEVIQWGKESGMYIPTIHPDTGKEVICISPDKLQQARDMAGKHYVFMK